MMNGEETDGGISLGDMEKALVCLLMTSMEAPVQAESAGLTQEMFADASLGFVYEVIMKIYATGVRPDMVLVERGMREADEELAAKLGGLSFLLPYMLNVRHDGNVAAYVEGIKKQYKLRCLVTLFGTMAFKAGKVSSVPNAMASPATKRRGIAWWGSARSISRRTVTVRRGSPVSGITLRSPVSRTIYSPVRKPL